MVTTHTRSKRPRTEEAREKTITWEEEIKKKSLFLDEGRGWFGTVEGCTKKNLRAAP